MTARIPAPAVLEGTRIQLEPFGGEHVAGLWAAIGRPEVFAGGWGGGTAGLPADEAEFGDWIRAYVPHERGSTFVVRLAGGADDGAIVGTSSLADFDVRRERAHLGWTAYDPRVWGTVVNPEAKRLILGHAFDNGFGRVKLQADARNERSRAAIAKLGATFEGVRRRDQLRADGTWRDAAIFSVTVDDWAEVRAALDARIASVDAPVSLAG